jgi:hypothetical protein
MALDETRRLRLRTARATALASAESDQAAEIAPRLTDLRDIERQLAGALVLTAHIDTHRPLLERLLASWPPTHQKRTTSATPRRKMRTTPDESVVINHRMTASPVSLRHS